jgi:hypothetical protein
VRDDARIALWLISVCLPKIRLTLELGQLRQQVVEIFAPACRVLAIAQLQCFRPTETFFDPAHRNL